MKKYIMLLGAVLALAACGQSEKEENKPAQDTSTPAQSTSTPAQDTAASTQSTSTPAQDTAAPAQSTIDQNTKE